MGEKEESGRRESESGRKRGRPKKQKQRDIRPLTDDDVGKLIIRWARDPVKFIEEAIGISQKTAPGLKLTTQQVCFFEELRRLVLSKVRLNVYGRNKAKNLEGFEDEYADKIGISVMTAKGVGKDTCASLALLWMLFCFPEARVPCTAPDFDSLSNVLFAEVVKWLELKDSDGRYVCRIRDFVVVQQRKIYLKFGGKNEGKVSFAEAKTAKQESESSGSQSVPMQGRHQTYQMGIIDEAPGVPVNACKSFEGTMTGPVNFVIMLWNPNKTSGYAYDSHFGKDRDRWVRMHWEASKSPLVSKSHRQYMLDKYGEHGAEYRIQILGLPPLSDPDTFIPIAWCEAALEREQFEMPNGYPIYLGYDVSRHGTDMTQLVARQGPNLVGIHERAGDKGPELARWVYDWIVYYDASGIAVCATGLGWSVCDHLEILNCPCELECFEAARSPADSPEKYYQLRDELWGRARDMLEKGRVSLKAEHPYEKSNLERSRQLAEELSNELAMPKLEELAGRIKIESKRNMRTKRRLHSPDKADAWIMTYLFDDAVAWKGKNQEFERYRRKRSSNHAVHSDLSWMCL